MGREGVEREWGVREWGASDAGSDAGSDFDDSDSGDDDDSSRVFATDPDAAAVAAWVRESVRRGCSRTRWPRRACHQDHRVRMAKVELQTTQLS